MTIRSKNLEQDSAKDRANFWSALIAASVPWTVLSTDPGYPVSEYIFRVLPSLAFFPTMTYFIIYWYKSTFANNTKETTVIEQNYKAEIKNSANSISKRVLSEKENQSYGSVERNKSSYIQKKTEQSEATISQDHFAQAYKEIDTNKKKEGLWAMAYANTQNEEEAKKKYINLRAEELHLDNLAHKRHEAEVLHQEKLTVEQEAENRELLERLPALISWAENKSYIINEYIRGAETFWEIKTTKETQEDSLDNQKSFDSTIEFAQHLAALEREYRRHLDENIIG